VLGVIVRVIGSPPDDNRREDYDALLAPADEAVQRTPRVEAGNARRGRALTGDQANVVKAVAMEARHRREEGGELVAVARVEQFAKSIEGVGRELLEIVGVHDVSSSRTGCPRFLHDRRNPVARLEDTTRGDLMCRPPHRA
jgi:hypothetical protein